MVIFALLAAVVLCAGFVFLWRMTSTVKAEVRTTLRGLDKASVALGGISREIERAEVHLARLTNLRVRRLVVRRIFSRPRRRLPRRHRT
ncbi:MAG: hypothetical protein ACJZ6C_03875 [Candidatus Poriferisodalaceae bacterium]